MTGENIEAGVGVVTMEDQPVTACGGRGERKDGEGVWKEREAVGTLKERQSADGRCLMKPKRMVTLGRRASLPGVCLRCFVFR